MSKRWEEINAVAFDIAFNAAEDIEDLVAIAVSASPTLLSGKTEGGRQAQAATYRRMVMAKLAELVKEKSQ